MHGFGLLSRSIDTREHMHCGCFSFNGAKAPCLVVLFFSSISVVHSFSHTVQFQQHHPNILTRCQVHHDQELVLRQRHTSNERWSLGHAGKEPRTPYRSIPHQQTRYLTIQCQQKHGLPRICTFRHCQIPLQHRAKLTDLPTGTHDIPTRPIPANAFILQQAQLGHVSRFHAALARHYSGTLPPRRPLEKYLQPGRGRPAARCAGR